MKRVEWAQVHYEDLREAQQELDQGCGLPMLGLFLDYVERGVQPPAEVLAWLAEGFQGWVKGGAKADLGQALCLKPKRGARSFQSEFSRLREDKLLLIWMDALVLLGATRDEAALIVQERHQCDRDWGWVHPTPSVETLLRKYSSKRDRLRLRQEDFAAFFGSSPGEFLADFGDAYMPEKLRAMKRVR